MRGSACGAVIGLLLLAGLTGCEGLPFDAEEAGYQGPHLALSYRVHVPFPADIRSLDPIFDDVTVYYPYADPPPGGFPVVVFSGGWNQEAISYSVLARNLAEWGFVCLLRASPNRGPIEFGPDLFVANRQHVRMLMDWAETQHRNPSSPLFRKLKLDRFGLAGHSFGGSVSVVTATEDPRVTGVVAMDAIFDFTNSPDLERTIRQSPPTMHQVAEMGGFCTFPPAGKFLTVLFHVVQAPVAELVLLGADHIDVDPLSEEGRIFCPQGTADEREVRKLAAKYMIAWFKVHVAQEVEAFEPQLHGALAQQDVAAGQVAINLNYDPSDRHAARGE